MDTTTKELNVIITLKFQRSKYFILCNTDQLTLTVWDMRQLHLSIPILLINRLVTYSLTFK